MSQETDATTAAIRAAVALEKIAIHLASLLAHFQKTTKTTAGGASAIAVEISSEVRTRAS